MSVLITCTTAHLEEVCRRLNRGDQTVFVNDVNSHGPRYPLLSIAKGPFRCEEGVLKGFSLQGVLHDLRLGGDFGTTVALRRDGSDWYEPGIGSHVLEILEKPDGI